MNCPLRSRMFAAASMAAGVTTTTLAAISVNPAVNLPLGANARPSGLAAGDFDGDGDIDLATTVDNANDVLVLLNDGAGAYSMGPNTNLPPSSSPQDVLAGDLNGDTIMDLAVAVRDPAGAVIIMLGNGNGTFATAETVLVEDRPTRLSIGDIEGDGDLDLAVSNRNSGSVSVLTNDGSASFSVQTIAITGEPRGSAFGNFDGDADADLAVANADNRSIDLFENIAGVFVFSMSLDVGPLVRPDGVAATDLDGNGSIDVAAATSDATLNINQVAVFLNTGVGFTGPVGYDTDGTNTSQIAAADLDCDGMIDLVVTNADSANASVLGNMGAGVFGAPMLIATGTTPGEIAIADFDAEGDLDIGVVNRDSDDVSIIINQSCPAVAPCPWDLGGDGAVGITDFLDLLAAWGPNPGHPADFDGDNAVGIVDFLILLNNWGPCP